MNGHPESPLKGYHRSPLGCINKPPISLGWKRLLTKVWRDELEPRCEDAALAGASVAFNKSHWGGRVGEVLERRSEGRGLKYCEEGVWGV